MLVSGRVIDFCFTTFFGRREFSEAGLISTSHLTDLSGVGDLSFHHGVKSVKTWHGSFGFYSSNCLESISLHCILFLHCLGSLAGRISPLFFCVQWSSIILAPILLKCPCKLLVWRWRKGFRLTGRRSWRWRSRRSLTSGMVYPWPFPKG